MAKHHYKFNSKTLTIGMVNNPFSLKFKSTIPVFVLTSVVEYAYNIELSTGSHAHNEVHINGHVVDPVNYFVFTMEVGQQQMIADQTGQLRKSMD